MIALIQRVLEARVEIAGDTVGSIERGILALVGVQPADDEAAALRLLDRLLKYRIFADEADKMNLSLQQISGGLLLVPQFTLAADTRHGLRPGFSTAAPPDQGRRLFTLLVDAARARHAPVASGVFGANMQVSLTNDGPVTLWLES
jgi:D-tyrosyl-tRNA(Tyr) deacylase